MMTLRQWSADDAKVPIATTWALDELGRSLGLQELFTRQSPQKLKALREHALIQSAQSSNRIEGVEVEAARMGTLVFGAPIFRDRNEEEVAGYQKALQWIHDGKTSIPVTEPTIRRLHALSRGDSWDAGQYKERAEPIIERRPGQADRVRFMPTAAGAPTESAMAEMVERYEGVGRDWIRTILRKLRDENQLRSTGHGAAARWERIGE